MLMVRIWMSPFSMALPKMLSRRGEENIFGKRVRMSNFILILPQALHPGDHHHPSFKVYALDHLIGCRQKDLSPFSCDHVDVICPCWEDLFHLSKPFAFPGFHLHAQDVHPIIFSL